MINKAIFFDRDGVFNELVFRPSGSLTAPWKDNEFRYLDGINLATQIAKEKGLYTFLVTNQPDINNGLTTKETVESFHERLQNKFNFDEIIFCPHSKSEGCRCRKPLPGMILQLANKWKISLQDSFMVGDTWKDIDAGKSAGCSTILIERDYNLEVKADYVVKNANEAANLVVKILY